ncbi:MAG: MBL fold metallo-hydrolase [Chloroflexi bacterium]|nr:MBL fold metallo-hydrolase [Chloroflexota bacterium]
MVPRGRAPANLEPSRMLRYVTAGTGSPRLSLARAGACHIALVEGEGLLFDCGPGATLRLFQGGFCSQSVGHVFLTHHHYDHMADLGHFALTRWDHTPHPEPLHVYGPPGTAGIARTLFGPQGVYWADSRIRTEHPMGRGIFAARGGTPPRPKPDVRAHDVAHGLAAEGTGWRVLAGPASHAQPIAECYSYRLDVPERSIVYSGDTGVCPEMVDFARGADTLVHMCCFFDDALERLGMVSSVAGPSLAGRVAAGAGVRKLVLTHPQSEEMDTPEGIRRAIADAARHFDGEIFFAEDLMEV